MKISRLLWLFSVVLLGLVSACNSELQPSEDLTLNQDNSTTANTVPASDLLAKITVYKSPTCRCCKGWVTYLEEEGFSVTAIDHDDVDLIKTQHGLHNSELKSCHTAIIDGYLVEGHVPANDIKRLLQERPTDVKGITAPGMPMKSPGMCSRIPKDYAVLSFTASGESTVYSQY